MERRVVRRVAVNSDTGKQWDAPWLEPVRHAVMLGATRFMSTLNSTQDKHSKLLLRFGGFAGICGGILWILLLTLIQLQAYEVIPYDTANSFYYTGSLFERLLLFPILLFFGSALGMLALQKQKPSRTGYLGILLVFIGLGLSAISVISEYWQDHYWGNFLMNDLLIIDRSYMGSWLAYILLGLLILTVGLILLLIANFKVALIPFPETTFLIGSLGVLLVYGLVDPQGQTLSPYGLFTILSVIFGLAWVFLGWAFLRKSRKIQRA